MERFARVRGATRRELEKVNAVRLYLRVITIADLTHPLGGYIPDGMLTGDWQAGSDLEWPHQPCPPRLHWALFQKFLKLTFFQKVASHQRANYSLELDFPLGKWYPVTRNTWFSSYKTETELFHQDEEAGTFQVFRTKGAGFYNYSHDTKEIPLQSHPICCKRVGQASWTHQKLMLSKEVLGQPQAPPGHMIYNNLLEAGD